MVRRHDRQVANPGGEVHQVAAPVAGGVPGPHFEHIVPATHQPVGGDGVDEEPIAVLAGRGESEVALKERSIEPNLTASQFAVLDGGAIQAHIGVADDGAADGVHDLHHRRGLVTRDGRRRR